MAGSSEGRLVGVQIFDVATINMLILPYLLHSNIVNRLSVSHRERMSANTFNQIEIRNDFFRCDSLQLSVEKLRME